MPEYIDNQNTDMEMGGDPFASPIQEHVSVLRKSNRSIAQEFEYLESFNSRESYESFQGEVAAIIKEAEAMTGAHITQEGINNKIRAGIEELASRYLQEAERASASYKKRNVAALAKLEKEIYGQENLTSAEIAQLSLRNSELQGEIRSKLHILKSPRDLEFEFKQLADQSQHDKTLARFLSKNYYLFLDRVKELDAGEAEKSRATHNIIRVAGKVKENGYSAKENAMLAVREHLSKRNFSTNGTKRNIEQQKRALLKKYQ